MIIYKRLVLIATCLTALLAIIPTLNAQSAPTIHLTLQQALERAPEANLQILLSEEAVLSQEEATNIARSGLLPQVSFNASQGRSMDPNVGSLTKSIPGIPERFFNDRFDAVLRARLSLLDFTRYDNWNISKLELKAVRFQVEDVVQEILRRISIAFFTHWRNERRLNVIDANLERDRLLLRIAVDQRDAGVATNLDVTRAEVRLAGNELARLQQETAVMQSALNLKQILNYPLEANLQLREIEVMPDSNILNYSPERFENVLKNRADYQQRQTEVERASLSYRAAGRECLPSLEVSGQWGYASESWTDDMKEQWAIQLGLNMPIFEGFRISSQRQLAASQMRQQEIQLDQLRQEIESNYRLTLQTLQSTAQQVTVSKRALSLSEREFELARIRFEEGVADNRDVTDAQAALADAEDGLVEAEYQYVQALINLARIEGDVSYLRLKLN